MSDKDKHKRGLRRQQFCAVPASPKCHDCPCPMDYIEVCEPETVGWSDYTFLRLVRPEDGPARPFRKKYEAHHLVCVAPVSKLLVEPASEAILKQTRWCINNGLNMLAMPLWGHTVKWYCTITAADLDVGHDAIRDHVRPDVGEPGFKNIPQHDWDHNSKEGYSWEVTVEVQKVPDRIEEKKQDHDIAGSDLAGELDRLSRLFRKTLKLRGVRKGGTDKAWKAAQGTPPDPEWCQPFSMASNSKLIKKGFPAGTFNKKLARWIMKMAEAIKGG